MNRSFSIIIVTWNGLNLLKRFLPGVLETDYPDYEVILADNASTDDTAEWVRNHFPEVIIKTFDRNYGYAEGNNLAAEYSDNDYLIFLNNDAVPEKEWLHHINRIIDEHDPDIIQPKIKSVDEPDKFEYAGAAGGFIDRLGYPFCRGRIFNHVETDYSQYDQPSPIFWASGAAFVIKNELFQNLGGFDSTFEFHMEEIDLCWRALKIGKKIFYAPGSVVYHLGGGSLDQNSPGKVFYNHRNSLIMLTKNLDQMVFPKILLRLLLDGITGIRFLFQLKPLHTFAIIRSHFSFYRLLPECLKFRKLSANELIVSTPKSLIYQNLIVFDFFLDGKKRFSDLNDFNPDEME